MLRPRTRPERALFALWRQLRPDDAFAQGIDASAGRLAVLTPRRRSAVLKRMETVARDAQDRTARRLLASWRARIVLEEPLSAPAAVFDAIFSHLMKEGIRADHMGSLARAGTRSIELARATWASKRVPSGMRALVQLASDGAVGIVRTVERGVDSSSTRQALDDLREALDAYRARFALEGFDPAASFEEAFDALRRGGSDLGRSRYYGRALRDLWDYRETPAQVEQAGLAMLRRELPRFRAVVRGLADDLACPPTGEAVEEALREKRGLRKDKIMSFLTELREVALRVADKHLVAVNPGYTTEVIETPEYLVNTTPSAAAFSLDTFTEHPRDIFLMTTDERSARRPPPGDLLSVLVHEEYGHCVHGSNAANAFAAAPGVLDVVNGPAVCVSEGLAFQMELDFLPIVREIAAGKARGPEERAFVEFFERWGGIDRCAREYEFQTLQGRIVRFLRVVGDARINSATQDIVRFVEWAHRRTGLQRATVYYNVFPAHQVLGPGYASTYAMIGETIRRTQAIALRRGKALRDFNGYATSIGWPPRSVFEGKLAAWARA
ncbi:MAG: hypothetical protein ACT4OI_04540 [Methanobacteriota archaeon]